MMLMFLMILLEKWISPLLIKIFKWQNLYTPFPKHTHAVTHSHTFLYSSDKAVWPEFQNDFNSIRKTVYYSKLILLQRFYGLEWNMLLTGVIHLIIGTCYYPNAWIHSFIYIFFNIFWNLQGVYRILNITLIVILCL